MEKVITDEDKIDELLSRGVEDVIVKEDLKKELLSGRQLRIKLGIDPTGPKIHIGRAIPLRKLREFQNLGHQIILIVGDFTAQVGDASDKNDKRPMLTRVAIDENLKDYKSQLAKIIDLDKTEFVYNNDWLSKLTFSEVTTLAECFSVQQMLARRNFKDRYENNVEISLREFLYPMMQGYDSVAVKADVEIGGFDQLFNLKAGRTIQEYYKMPKQNLLTVSMLPGTDGRKMSTAWGNIISIVDDPNTMFGKIMSLHDDLILKYFLLCTDVPQKEIASMEQELKDGANPRDIKMKLAGEIVTMYHGEMDATQAKNSFIETFQKGGIPENIPEILIDEDKDMGEALVEAKIVESKSEWKRLVESGAITKEDGTDITDYKQKAIEGVIRVGKKRFVKLVTKH